MTTTNKENEKIIKEATYYIGVPEDLISPKTTPKFHSQHKSFAWNGARLIKNNVLLKSEILDIFPEVLDDGETYQVWEKLNNVYNLIDTYAPNIGMKEIKTIPNNNDVEISELRNQINTLEDYAQANQSGSQDTMKHLSDMVQMKDRQINDLYTQLNNIHSQYNTQLQDKVNEIANMKAEIEKQKIEFENHKKSIEFEKTMKELQEKEMTKLRHEYDGRLTSLSDQLDSAEQDDFLDKADKLLNNPLMQKLVSVGTQIVEQQMAAQSVATQQPYNNYQAPFQHVPTNINPIEQIKEAI